MLDPVIVFDLETAPDLAAIGRALELDGKPTTPSQKTHTSSHRTSICAGSFAVHGQGIPRTINKH